MHSVPFLNGIGVMGEVVCFFIEIAGAVPFEAFSRTGRKGFQSRQPNE